MRPNPQETGPESNEVIRTPIDQMDFSRLLSGFVVIEGGLAHAENGNSSKPERVDNFDEVLSLERTADATQYIRSWYARPDLTPTERALAPLTQPMHAVEHIGNQFAVRIIPTFLTEDPDEALEKFRAVVPNTTQQEMVLLINDDHFRELHEGLHAHLAETEVQREQEVAHRFLEDLNVPGTYVRADRNQFSGNETPRSLDNILKNGINLSVDPENLAELREAYDQVRGGIIPITEIVKNSKMLNIIGFTGSKISLAVHDAIDHTWMYAMLRERGYLDDYRGMLDSIGNPHHTDMFSREGETLASVAYGVRYFGMVENGFQPIIDTSEILGKFDDMFQAGELTEARHIRAYRKLRGIAPGSREWHSLGFTYSNYVVELNEQRRKHGKIKQRDNDNKIIGELDPGSPDFMSIFVEAHHELHDSRNKHRNTLFRFHILLEQYLLGVATGVYSTDQQLKIKVQDLKDTDLSSTVLPPGRLHWMNRNYGYTSVKDCIF